MYCDAEAPAPLELQSAGTDSRSIAHEWSIPPLVEAWPAGQAAQLTWPSLPEYFPAVHSTHDVGLVWPLLLG